VCGAPPCAILPHAIGKHAVCLVFLKLKDHVVFGKNPGFKATKIFAHCIRNLMVSVLTIRLINESAFIFPGTYLNFVFLWVWKLWGKLFSFFSPLFFFCCDKHGVCFQRA